MLHGATDIFESNALSTWLHVYPPLSKLAQTKASKYIKAWEMVMESKGPWGHYYADDPRYFIKSEKNETLLNFIIQMATKTEILGKGDRIEWRALKSFLSYLRKTYPKEEVVNQQNAVKNALRDYDTHIPVIFNMNFGHTDPQIIIPNGGMATIDFERKSILFN